jgi:integrase
MPKELRRIKPGLSTDKRSELARRAAEWRAAHCWSPHQIRHTAATEIRRRFGLEAAQVALGHSKMNVTEIYAEKNDQLAAYVAREVG